MSISVQCGSCGKGYRVSDDKAGKRLKCRDCGGIVPIPAPAEEIFDDDDFGDDYGDSDYGAGDFGAGDFGADAKIEPRRPVRRSSSKSRSRSQPGVKKKKAGKSSGGNFNSPKQLMIGAGVLVATIGIVVAILFQRGILGGDKKKSADDEKVSDKNPDRENPATRFGRQLPGQAGTAGTGNGRQNQAASGKVSTQWRRYSPPDQSFTIEFPPGKMSAKSEKSPTGDDNTVVGVEKEKNHAYTISWFVRPAFRKMSNQAKMTAIQKIAKATKLKSIHSRQVGGHPGLEGVQERPRRVHFVITFVDDRIYFLLEFGPKTDVPDDTAKRFFKSFHPRKTSSGSAKSSAKKE